MTGSLLAATEAPTPLPQMSTAHGSFHGNIMAPGLRFDSLYDLARLGHHVVHGEAKVLQQFLNRSRCAEVVPGNNISIRPDVLTPAEAGARFDGHARPHLRRQYLALVLGGLLIEQPPARHGDDARLNAFCREPLIGANAKLHLRAGPDQDDVGCSAGISHDVRTLGKTRSRRVLRAVKRGNGLPGEHQRRWYLFQRHNVTPRLGDLVRIRWPEEQKPRNGSQGYEMLDRLVRWPVLAQAERIVCVDEDHRLVHHRCHSQYRSHVIRKDEEGRSVRTQS